MIGTPNAPSVHAGFSPLLSCFRLVRAYKYTPCILQLSLRNNKPTLVAYRTLDQPSSSARPELVS